MGVCMGNLIKTELIENYIKQHDLSKNKFCKLCKISPSVLKKIMKTQRNFYIIALFKIAKIINLEVYQLFED